MDDYYKLQQQLLVTTCVFSGIIFVSVIFAYSWHIALNYLLGACTGVVYLRMLSKRVAQLGRQGSRNLGSGRLAIVAALILVASQWSQLEILPVFLGFLTYKAALIGYTIWSAIPPD
ncbi:MAG: ATP synthase subunit I [Leptolyngbyaceae cyanobacterium T60_A2020_046]|nr:ATP synthase subunit I [Leptolyngbyaceae cyanobacterium T60_A2020_046]